MEEKKEKRVLSIELDDDVKKVSITGLGDDNQVVMAQELDEDELDQATGGGGVSTGGRNGSMGGGWCNMAESCRTHHADWGLNGCRYKKIDY
jgi:hypothetical protein